MYTGFSCRGGISVGQFVHNLCVAGSHSDPSTGFDGSETRRPSGSTKGRHLRMAAFFAFYRQFWQPLRASRFVSKSPSRSAARPTFATLASSFRPNFARNSRLSLRLAPAGLTTVAIARPVADDMVASGRSHSAPQTFCLFKGDRAVVVRIKLHQVFA